MFEFNDLDRPSFGTFLSKSAIAGSKDQMWKVLHDENGRKAFDHFCTVQFPDRCDIQVDAHVCIHLHL
jgi:hypothetical protein